MKENRATEGIAHRPKQTLAVILSEAKNPEYNIHPKDTVSFPHSYGSRVALA